ncbi:MAG: hypothetical protein PVI86_11330 [Phycisphaerae bacterium]
MNSKDLAIGILSTTAAILLVGLLVVNTLPAPVQASGMTVTGGAYTVAVGMDVSADQELVYVIDAPTEKLIVYRFDGGRGVIEIAQGIDLKQLRASNAGQPGQAPSRRPGSRGRNP